MRVTRKRVERTTEIKTSFRDMRQAFKTTLGTNGIIKQREKERSQRN